MSQPQVACIVPLHDHEKWVCGAIDSLHSQDYEKKFIVVVDDGSTDGSLGRVLAHMTNCHETTVLEEGRKTFIGEIQGRTTIVVLSYEKASGPSFARNRGLEVASRMGAEIFAFLDSDDLYEPTKISRSVEEFVKAPGLVGAVYSDFDTVGPDGLRLRQYREPFSRSRLLRECIVNCDSLVSAEAIEACGPFDEDLRVCEDYDRWLALSERFLIVHVPESLVQIRVGPHSSTATVKSDTWKSCWSRVMQKTEARARNATSR